jgi:hypothetical protein
LSTSGYIKVNEPEEINQFQFNEEDDENKDWERFKLKRI